MPLSKANPRNQIHSRDIQARGYQRDDGLWDIESRLIDTKTYSFDNTDRGQINSGEAIHELYAGLRAASVHRPIALLSLDSTADGAASLTLRSFRKGDESVRQLATAQPHGRWLSWSEKG